MGWQDFSSFYKTFERCGRFGILVGDLHIWIYRTPKRVIALGPVFHAPVIVEQFRNLTATLISLCLEG